MSSAVILCGPRAGPRYLRPSCHSHQPHTAPVRKPKIRTRTTNTRHDNNNDGPLSLQHLFCDMGQPKTRWLRGWMNNEGGEGIPMCLNCAVQRSGEGCLFWTENWLKEMVEEGERGLLQFTFTRHHWSGWLRQIEILKFRKYTNPSRRPALPCCCK